MTIDVEFWIKGLDGAFLAEEEVDPLGARFAEADALPGLITIVVGATRVTLSDDLDYLVPRLCFQSIRPLRAGAPFQIIRANASGAYELRPIGDRVWLSGVDLVATSFDKDELLTALTRCGLRFLALLRSLHTGDGHFQGVIDELETSRAQMEGREGAPR